VKTDASGPAVQSAILSRDGEYLSVVTTTLEYMARAAVWQTDGKRVGDIPSVAEEPPLKVTTQILNVGSGMGHYAAVIRPRNFRKGTKYPVVLQVYGGPHKIEVKNSLREELLLQWLADQGFIVVKSDNRGTTFRRGRDWERAIKFDLAGIPMDDQVAALRALANEVPEMDMDRVGITGWSYGGYMAALGMLRYPDVFRVGVAGAAVTDWRTYDTFYTERYMGLPGDHEADYQRASLLTQASKLKGSLLIIHGTADDNVYFFHSLRLSNALFREGKVHDFLPLSDFTHMVADPNVLVRLNQRMVKQFNDALKK
jgi:dipeptidyl-peptidase-4